MKLALEQAVPHELRRMISLVGWGGLLALLVIAAAMVVRRTAFPVSGGSSWAMLGCGALGFVLIVSLRELALWEQPFDAAGKRSLILISGTIAILLTLAAIALPPTSLTVVLLLGGVALGEEAFVWTTALRGRRKKKKPAAKTAESFEDSPTSATAVELGEADSHAEEESEELLPADCLQQLTRSRGEAGGEVIYALLRAEFEVGERQQWLHVAFCPPLARRPQCSAHFAEGDGAVLEVEEVETYGARLMVRLPQPATEPQNLLVEMFAEVQGRDP